MPFFVPSPNCTHLWLDVFYHPVHFLSLFWLFKGFCHGISDLYVLYFNQISSLYYLLFLYCPVPLLLKVYIHCVILYSYRDAMIFSIFHSLTSSFLLLSPHSHLRQNWKYNLVISLLCLYAYEYLYVYIYIYIYTYIFI
jgi:hypothetical protein